MCDNLCTAEFLITRSRDTQANLYIVCSSHTRKPTTLRAHEARTTRNRLGQMLNTSIRVWSSFCCMLTPSSLVRVILSVNYSIVGVKIRSKPSQRWKYKKGLNIVSIFTCEEKHSLVKLSPQQRLAFIYIGYNTASCSPVAITLKGLAGLEQRPQKFSLNRLYFESLMLSIQSISNHFQHDTSILKNLHYIWWMRTPTGICLHCKPKQNMAQWHAPVLSIPEEQSTNLRSDDLSL